jgi:hypothetical protein
MQNSLVWFIFISELRFTNYKLFLVQIYWEMNEIKVLTKFKHVLKKNFRYVQVTIPDTTNKVSISVLLKPRYL